MKLPQPLRLDARIDNAARGVAYLIIGALAVMAVVGGGGQVGCKGALAAGIAAAGAAQSWKGPRGLIFLIVAALFVFAAITVDPSQAGKPPDALSWIREQPYGGILYAAVAAGLVAFGLYSLIEAQYRRIGDGEKA